MEKYIAIYWQYHIMKHEDFDSLDSAINFLNESADYGQLLQVAVIDRDTKEIKWRADFYPKDEIRQVSEYINNFL